MCGLVCSVCSSHPTDRSRRAEIIAQNNIQYIPQIGLRFKRFVNVERPQTHPVKMQSAF